jgi:sugar O-acyltransferase (sialic acid O-acetyltransferase NeuD family)
LQTVKTKEKLVIIGDSQFAQIAAEYLKDFSQYEVVAFSVPYEFKQQFTLNGLPVIDFEEIEDSCPPETHKAFCAIAFSRLNRNREKMFNEAQFKGYELISFVHPKAFVASSAKIGKNVFLFEGNVVQSHVVIEDGVVAWSGNHFGHGSYIGKFAFLSSHSVISGNCKVGAYSFLGVNSTLTDGITLGDNVVIGAASLVVKNVPSNSQIKGKASFPDEVNTMEKFGLV